MPTISIALDCHQFSTHIEVEKDKRAYFSDRLIRGWQAYLVSPSTNPRFGEIVGVNRVLTVDYARIVTVVYEI